MCLWIKRRRKEEDLRRICSGNVRSNFSHGIARLSFYIWHYFRVDYEYIFFVAIVYQD